MGFSKTLTKSDVKKKFAVKSKWLGSLLPGNLEPGSQTEIPVVDEVGNRFRFMLKVRNRNGEPMALNREPIILGDGMDIDLNREPILVDIDLNREPIIQGDGMDIDLNREPVLVDIDLNREPIIQGDRVDIDLNRERYYMKPEFMSKDWQKFVKLKKLTAGQTISFESSGKNEPIKVVIKAQENDKA